MGGGMGQRNFKDNDGRDDELMILGNNTKY